MKWRAYYRLMRLDKPIGILLLWYPTAWALWLANNGKPPLYLVFQFFIGTVLMRSAGCIINDLADRNIDKHVRRTRLRPLAAGEISVQEAIILLFILLWLAFLVLVFLPTACFIWALFALGITFLYPFCKRFLNAPQVILGLAFSMGIPMVYVASGVMISKIILLLVINFCWIIAYDTMYAMVDKEDDLKIGVKSTAIYFARYDRFIIGSLLFIMHFLWLFVAEAASLGLMFYILWLMAGGVLLYQQSLIHKRLPEQCFRSFLISSYYGALMWLAVL